MKKTTQIFFGMAIMVAMLFTACKKNTPPVFDLNGAADTSICLGEQYAPIIATALDAYGDAINVLVTNGVDINTAGTYDVEYLAIDKNDNEISHIIQVIVELCASSLTGQYSVSHDCQLPVVNMNLISEDQEILPGITSDAFIINNFNSILSQVTGSINGASVTIDQVSFTVPVPVSITTVDVTVSLSGSGTVDANGVMTINYEYSGTAALPVPGLPLTGNCTATYTKL